MNLKIEIKKILKGDKPTKAYANIVFDNGFVIHGVGVCQNEKGRYVTFPMTSWKKDGEEITRPVCPLFLLRPVKKSKKLYLKPMIRQKQQIKIFEGKKI